MKPPILVIVAALLAAACSPALTPSDSPTPLPDTAVISPVTHNSTFPETPVMPSYSPKPGDIKLERANVFISESGIVLRESFPVQVVLGLKGELPTPCHQLRVIVDPPDAENNLHVEAYTVVSPEIICIQVVKPFTETIELGTFPTGHYTVWINGTRVGEFDT
jgi:hypothetical protein